MAFRWGSIIGQVRKICQKAFWWKLLPLFVREKNQILIINSRFLIYIGRLILYYGNGCLGLIICASFIYLIRHFISLIFWKEGDY